MRGLALLLAIAFALLSMQLMAKQRLHEQVDTRYLARWERAVGIVPVEGFARPMIGPLYRGQIGRVRWSGRRRPCLG